MMGAYSNRNLPPGVHLSTEHELNALRINLLTDIRPDIWHGSFTRLHGVSNSPFDSLNTAYSSGDEPSRVTQNRNLVLHSLDAGKRFIIVPDLQHTCNIHYISKDYTPQDNFITVPHTDAIISNSPDCLIMLSTADCNPILFLDRKIGTIAAAHAGWRGIVGNIVEQVANQMMMHGCSPEDIFVGVGPSIGPCCYKLENPAQLRLPSWKNYLSSAENGLLSIDLWTPVMDQLCRAGIPQQNIMLSRVCTACYRDIFFSYWVDKPATGRFASVIFRR